MPDLSLDLIMFAAACVVLLAGFPVAFTLAGIALLFALIGWQAGLFEGAWLLALPQRIFGIMTNERLVAVPLFIFMGTMLERSRVAEDLLENMGRLFGSLRGGLGISVSIVGALLAASTGIVGATVVTMGLLSLPVMLRRGYDIPLATGSIAAAGTLGQIIPPSIVLVLLGDVLSNAYQKAQLEQGIFTPKALSAGDLFAGALLPGLMLVGLYILYQISRAFLDPKSSPPLLNDSGMTQGALYRNAIQALIPPVLLIISVLGSILAGIATPTEAAAVGAVGATLLAGYRQEGSPLPVLGAAGCLVAILLLTAFVDLRLSRDSVSGFEQVMRGVAFLFCIGIAQGLVVALYRLAVRGLLGEVTRSSAMTSCMVFVILIGATLFSLVFRGLGGDETVQAFLAHDPASLTNQIFGTFGPVFLVMLVMFILGFFLDFIEITFVVVPLVAPVLLAMGFDPVWLGVMMAINLQTSFLTPPFGFALFYLRGVAPDTVRTVQIYRGVLPFVLIQILAMVMIACFPVIATWLPTALFGS